MKETRENPSSAPDILDEGEAWCENCCKVVFQIGPWQDICPCGTFLTRSGYDDEEITKHEAQNTELTDRRGAGSVK
jgi:hypothetical protein